MIVENLSFGGLILMEDGLKLINNSRLLVSLTYKELSKVEIIYKRRSRWLLETLLGVCSLGIPTFIILTASPRLVSEPSDYHPMNWAIISGLVLFVFLGVYGLKAISKKFFIRVNSKYEIEIPGTDLMQKWNQIENFLIDKGLVKGQIFWFKH